MLGRLVVMATLHACGFGEHHPIRMVFGGGHFGAVTTPQDR
jgi:hypothetical protein